MKILILTAIERELQTLCSSLHEIHIVYTGVGKVSAAISSFKALKEERCDLVLNVGTAGSKHLSVGSIVAAVNFVDRDMEQAADFGAVWKISTNHLLHPNLHSVFQPDAICNTGDRFVTEHTHSEGDVFDMEAFAEAAVCIALQQPFLSIKYVTDQIGKNSVKGWEEMLQDARIGLEKYIENLLQKLPQQD